MQSEERLYQLALYFTPGVGNLNFRQLIAYTGSAKAVFEGPKGKLEKIPGIGPKIIKTIASNKEGFAKAEEELKKIENKKVRLVLFTDHEYPSRLKHIPDSPSLFFMVGNTEVLKSPRTLGIVGTRNATQYGKDITDEIVKACQGRNIAIMSGLAYGIDIQAHRSSLKYNVPTLGVIASGLDKIYPSSHTDVARQMCTEGGILTEHPMGTVPDAYNFPARNRIVAGLSDALIVVEAGQKGGALITADLALHYNKEVYAVPGTIDLPYSKGCNELIRQQKAQIFTDVDQLFEDLEWFGEAENIELSKKSDLQPEDFNQEEWAIITALKTAGGSLIIDEISWSSQVPLSKLAGILLSLEFKGILRALPGKRFALV